ncbi:hypothetical protein HPP92_013204 [Vanilla planifolia]|uniref:Uncharacterized protein n=1 Tax=Vanilla planifolia TaxID=51239 RepID=A0A835UWF8_VANPL|nr:hypothetical protein HPP92_013204 [Vanilla planifolia]
MLLFPSNRHIISQTRFGTEALAPESSASSPHEALAEANQPAVVVVQARPLEPVALRLAEPRLALIYADGKRRRRRKKREQGVAVVSSIQRRRDRLGRSSSPVCKVGEMKGAWVLKGDEVEDEHGVGYSFQCTERDEAAWRATAQGFFCLK